MATDKTGTWSLGESVLWYTPNSTLDNTWSYGENAFLDEYVAAGGGRTTKNTRSWDLGVGAGMAFTINKGCSQ